MKSKLLITIVGPTGIGKTELAIKVAQYFNTEIISADSRQFYKELNIGVARPTEEELSRAKHHFISSHSIFTPLSAGQFAREAEEKLDSLFSSHDVVVVVGGSGLFIDALINGIDDLPSDTKVKEKFEQLKAEKGIEELQLLLKSQDPEYYSSVDISNPHRLIRALEVIQLTGKKFSSLRSGRIQHPSPQAAYHHVKIGLTADREYIYNRINARVDKMMNDGLLSEVHELIDQQHLIALNTVGYKELFDHINGHCTLEFSIEKIKQHTRNYAKRQLTWWKRQEDISWILADSTTPIWDQFLSILQLKVE